MLPDDVASARMKRLDHIVRVRHVHHAVVDQRGAGLKAIRERAGPDQAELPHVAAVDLVEWAVAPAIQRAAPHQPVTRSRVLEHLVGDGDELARVLGDTRPEP